MAGSVSLFRKWRSQNFADLLGQDAVVRTLRNVLSANSPARAYLFCGPRGTGKTSTARIFAKALCCEQAVNLEPCNNCSTCTEISSGVCLDVLEIDAASHTQVDKIRDFIVDKVHFAPARARFKVYIIDEVHKLSSSSFNALLKTLEEPPPHVVFVLATTHPHELLPTILSRCQRYDFRPFSLGQIRAHLNHVATTEGFVLEPEAGLALARAAGGSMRDALVLLEQAYAYCGDAVNTAAVIQMLGWLPAETLEHALGHLQRGEAGAIMGLLQSLAENGQDFVRFVDQMVDQLRILMLLKVQAADSTFHELPEGQQQSLTELAKTLGLPQILAWLRALIDSQQAIREGATPRLLCEMTLVQLASGSAAAAAGPGLEALQKRVEALENGARQGAPAGKPAAGFVPPRPNLDAPRPPVPAPAAFAPPPPREASPAFVPPPPRESETFTPAPPREAAASSPREPVAEKVEGPFVNPLEMGKTSARTPSPAPAPPPTRSEAPAPRPAAPAPVRNGSQSMNLSPMLKDFWLNFLGQVNQKDKRLFALLQEAWPAEFTPPNLLLLLPDGHKFHRDNILQSRSLLEPMCKELLGQEVKLDCQFDATGRKASGDDEHRALVKKASGLFAGKIVQP